MYVLILRMRIFHFGKLSAKNDGVKKQVPLLKKL